MIILMQKLLAFQHGVVNLNRLQAFQILQTIFHGVIMQVYCLAVA